MTHDMLPQSDDPMIIFQVRKSEWFVIGPLFFVGVTAVLLIGALYTSNLATSLDPFLQVLVFLIVMFGFAVAALITYLDWVNTYYVLTSHTIEKVSGFVTKNKTYMSLHDLSKIEARIGILGRAFDFGTVELESETSETPLHLVGVSDPNKIINLVRAARSHVPGTDM